MCNTDSNMSSKGPNNHDPSNANDLSPIGGAFVGATISVGLLATYIGLLGVARKLPYFRNSSFLKNVRNEMTSLRTEHSTATLHAVAGVITMGAAFGACEASHTRKVRALEKERARLLDVLDNDTDAHLSTNQR
jgi:hypothetical protein